MDNIAAISKDWDRLLATMYSIPELRRPPAFSEMALRRRWTTKGSRVRREIPYPSISEIRRELEDLGYVPDSFATKVSQRFCALSTPTRTFMGSFLGSKL